MWIKEVIINMFEDNVELSDRSLTRLKKLLDMIETLDSSLKVEINQMTHSTIMPGRFLRTQPVKNINQMSEIAIELYIADNLYRLFKKIKATRPDATITLTPKELSAIVIPAVIVAFKMAGDFNLSNAAIDRALKETGIFGISDNEINEYEKIYLTVLEHNVDLDIENIKQVIENYFDRDSTQELYDHLERFKRASEEGEEYDEKFYDALKDALESKLRHGLEGSM